MGDDIYPRISDSHNNFLAHEFGYAANSFIIASGLKDWSERKGLEKSGDDLGLGRKVE